MTTGSFCPVGKLETLLLSTDGTEFSEGAIREAIRFAARCGSTIHVLKVIHIDPEHESAHDSIYERENSMAGDHLAKIADRIKQEGLPCEPVIRTGYDIHQAIVGYAREKAVDMIIIGRRGAKGIRKLFIGEVAAKVIGNAPCKVLIVPREAHISYRMLLLCTDGSKHSEAAASEGIGIAGRCGSSVIAVSCIHGTVGEKDAELYTAGIVRQAEAAGVHAEAVIMKGKPEEKVLDIAGGRGADLIVAGTYGKTGIKSLIMGPTVEQIISRSPCAVLVVRATDETAL